MDDSLREEFQNANLPVMIAYMGKSTEEECMISKMVDKYSRKHIFLPHLAQTFQINFTYAFIECLYSVDKS